jgi:hypothetical protein
MAESLRKRGGAGPTLEDEQLKRHERTFMITFAIGLSSLVAAMIFIAQGLSSDFDLGGVAFITFAVLAGLTAVSWSFHWWTGRSK